MTTKEEISSWLESEKAAGYRCLIVWCDTYDYTDYPEGFNSLREAYEAAQNPRSMTKFMEFYDLHRDFKPQLDKFLTGRLLEIASLEEGWNPDFPNSGGPSTAAVNNAQVLLNYALSLKVPQPGIFLNTDGGISLEWANSEEVISIDIKSDSSFELFHLDKTNETLFTETSNILEVKSFIRDREQELR